MTAMAVSYEQLLDATIQHLERLKERGTKFVAVSPDAFRELSTPLAPGASSGAPAPHPPPPEQTLSTPLPPVAAAHVARANAPTAAPALAQGSAAAALVQPSFDLAKSASSSVSLSRDAKETAMAELSARAAVCQKCPHLASSRKSVVFGVGDIHSPLMFVGEAPGADEDEQGEPFVGKAGQLLTRIIQTMSFGRDTVYIANILKCRPDTPGQTAGNRKPTPAEMKTCLPYLLEQVDLIQPKVIVALGATAVEGLLGKVPGITRLRGNWQTFRDIPLMPTYHPAYLLRNQALSEKRKVWEDMLQVLEKLGRPITDKQRGFFLKT